MRLVFIFYSVCPCVHMSEGHMCASAHEGLERVLDYESSDLSAGNQTGSSRREASALSYRDISSDLVFDV